MTVDPTNAVPVALGDVAEAVRTRYAAAAVRARASAGGTDPAGCGCGEPCFGSSGYTPEDLAALPVGAVAGSLGCGNPTALADLHDGEIVLDLGCGGGIDVILSARRVAPTGRAYGLDMTDEMLALARDNALQAGVENVAFLKGRIEAIPLADREVDVVLSNCVVNLSGDKRAVLREAFRVLRPGGRLAISDVVVRQALSGEPDIPPAVRRSMELWAGCIAGALDERDYRALLAAAGFVEITVYEVRRYRAEDMGDDLARALTDHSPGGAAPEAVSDRFMSAFVRAVRPQGV